MVGAATSAEGRFIWQDHFPASAVLQEGWGQVSLKPGVGVSLLVASGLALLMHLPHKGPSLLVLPTLHRALPPSVNYHPEPVQTKVANTPVADSW